ncbi:glutamate--cysteine ligase [Jatrophihabitans telluris]|uniref:Putative glutamate--cysteine ligase 2 n=1 Tax=Jatrophihabitans telluris TaxID=2038343 RepID=A0ABY4QZX4_9ACTN|nr:glutamate--cysteine ligase [Jatrophihabitans telluris]UQX88566.1 glutamate--cysteine ligase [Jatrophihabitans telluris]
MQIDFVRSLRPTLGVEWELALVDKQSGDLVSVAEQVLNAVRPHQEPEHPKIKQELLLNTVELVTGVCRNAAEAAADLAASVAEVREVIDPMGVELFSAGAHPFADWHQQRVTDYHRYATLIDRTQWWGRQMLIYGVHVHVGISSVHKVLPILNGLLTYHPHLQALSASSPYWGGTDTGYASNRALMFQQLPTAGLPFQFGDWSGYESYVADMLTTGVIDDLSEIRWDIRPSPKLGTIEVRVCDGLPTLAEVTAVAALIHCLVVYLDGELDRRGSLPTLPPWHVQENKWRAARYGLEAEIILDAAGRERLVTEELADLVDCLTPVAIQLDCAYELASVMNILTSGASYQRQRLVAEANGGNLAAVVDSLVREMRAGRPLS